MRKETKVFLILMLCVAMLLMAGCRPESEESTKQPDTSGQIGTPAPTGEPDPTPLPTDNEQPVAPEVDDTNWTIVDNLSQVKDFINNGGSLDRTQESAGIVTFATSTGNADHQLLCQFAEAAENITAFKISTTVTAGTGRRGIGFKTPDGYLFFNVVANGGENGAGYVEFDVNTDGNKKNQAYQALSAEAEAIIAGDEAYTLKLVAKDLTGTSADTITLYVNNIAVYTYTNTLGWDLTAKVLPAIGVRGDGASATFSDYSYGIVPGEAKQNNTQSGSQSGTHISTPVAPTDNINWTQVTNFNTVTGFINQGGTVDRANETQSSVKFTTNKDNAANQLLCQFAGAGENISAFKISTIVTTGTGRRGVGFKTPDGYLFFNVVANGGANGVGYVVFNVSNGSQVSQSYKALSKEAQKVVGGSGTYMLTLVAKNLTGKATDTITFYVNDIAVYTYTNTLGWDLTAKVLPAIGVRGGPASATFTNYTFKVVYEGSDQDDTQETAPDTSSWTTVSLLNSINGFINNNGSLTRPGVSGGAAVFATSEGNAANQLLCQFANAAENVKSFEISTTVTAGTGRRGVGFKTPSGYLFFNVTKEGGANGAGYVWYNTDYAQQTQDYVALSTAAKAVVAGAEAYTLKLVAKDLTGTSADTITLYVNNIAVYTYTNTLGWDLTAKVLPAIGVRGGPASATFTNYTFKVVYEEPKQDDTCEHTGGTATCKTQATCEICGESYGDLNSANHEGETEIRDAKEATCGVAGYTGDTYCVACDTKIADGTEIDATGEHTGGTATCKTQATCEICGESYGDLNSANHEGETEIRDAKEATCGVAGYTGDTYCVACDTKIADGTEIDATGEHTGGTATCKTQATCDVCGEPYGEPNSANHVGETEIRDAKEATSSEAGYTGDTYCVACDTKIADGTVIDATGDDTETLTVVDLLSQVSGYGFINNGGSLDRTRESSGIVTLATNTGSADNQILLQFANAAENISAFEISATVTAGTGRRGVGFKTPDGYLFFNIVENGGANGAGYVEFNATTTAKVTQAYQTLAAEAETVITGNEAYTLKLVAENLTGEATDTITFYVNDIAVYTYTNTLDWDLTAKVLPAIGVRGGGSATFTEYTFKVAYKTQQDDTCEHTGGTATCKTQATCEICDESYGDLNSANHEGESEIRDAVEATCGVAGYTGDTYCVACDTKIADGTVIDATGEHTGGTATCTTKATCDVCGEPYGEPNSANHVGETEIRDAKEATSSEAGYTGDTYCVACDTKIADGTVIDATGDDTETLTVVDNLSQVSGYGFINNGGSLDRTWESSGIVTLATNTGSADNQILLQFANAAENISAFEISATVTAGTGRRGVGFKTPDGYLFFNIVENGGANGAGYVEFNATTTAKVTQAYQTLAAEAETVITGNEAYTLKLVAENLTGAATDTITFYVNDIAVYTYTNTLGWDLTAKVLPAIGVRGGGSATFTEYTFKVAYETQE